MSDYDPVPKRLSLSNVTGKALVLSDISCITTVFPPRRVFEVLNDIQFGQLSPSITGVGIGGRVTTVTPVGGIGPFVITIDPNDDDDDDEDYDVDDYDIVWDVTPDDDCRTITVRATDVNGDYTTKEIEICGQYVFPSGTPTPNQPDIGTPDSNPSYILQYTGVTFVEPNSGITWTSGDVREVWPNNAILTRTGTPYSAGQTVDLGTSGLTFNLHNVTLASGSVPRIYFQFVHGVTSEPNNAADITVDNSVPSVSGNFDTIDPNYTTWTHTGIVDGEMFFPCTLTFDDGKVWNFYKGQKWP